MVGLGRLTPLSMDPPTFSPEEAWRGKREYDRRRKALEEIVRLGEGLEQGTEAGPSCRWPRLRRMSARDGGSRGFGEREGNRRPGRTSSCYALTQRRYAHMVAPGVATARNVR